MLNNLGLPPRGVRRTLTYLCHSEKKKEKHKKSLTINADLAVTVAVTSGQESLGLLVSECSGRSTEVLQEQPGRWPRDVNETLNVTLALIFIHSCKVCVLLQLLLLNEAAVVLVNDGEGLLDIICALAREAAHLKELLVVEGVGSWNAHTRHDNVRPFS